MKTALGALTSTLYTTSSFMVAELFTFEFAAGAQRWTTADADISRNNLLKQSQALGTSPWGTSVGAGTFTITNNYAAAPDATTTATRVQLVGGLSNSSILRQYVAVLPLVQYTLSFWNKNISGATARLSIFDETNAASIVPTSDYSTTVGSWVRVTQTFTAPAGCVLIQVAPVHNILTGDYEFYLWGAQLIPGASAGTYTPTTTVTASDGVFVSTGPGLTRESSRTSQGTEVSTMDITIAPGTATLGGLSMSLAAVRGGFDNVPVRIDRAYMTTWGIISKGLVNVFSGTIVSVEPGNSEIKLTVKSGLHVLNEYMPRRNFQPQCPFMVYDIECGVNEASFTAGKLVAAGTTTSVLKMNSATGFAVAGSRVVFTGGALLNQSFTVTSASGVDLTLFPRMPSVPATSDSFNVIRGCDKTRATCNATFSNVARFGGFPDAPPDDFQLPGRDRPTREIDRGYYDPRTGTWRHAP